MNETKYPLLYPYDPESVRKSLEIRRQINEEREADLQRMEAKARRVCEHDNALSLCPECSDLA